MWIWEIYLTLLRQHPKLSRFRELLISQRLTVFAIAVVTITVNINITAIIHCFLVLVFSHSEIAMLFLPSTSWIKEWLQYSTTTTNNSNKSKHLLYAYYTPRAFSALSHSIFTTTA